jgi:tetratricopeptide (TPR) repeat protein
LPLGSISKDMERIEKTVFISYRRTNFAWALAVYQNLTHHGYDVFLDYSGIASGDFESAILGNIKARAHFLVVLTPSALERCENPADWLRREIETALTYQRNIVPLMLEGFDFNSPAIVGQLQDALTSLKRYNGLSVPQAYFEEAMERLRSKYLNVPLSAVLHPVSGPAQRAASEQKAAASAAPLVKQVELTYQELIERGFAAADNKEKLELYSEAIRLKPDCVLAFIDRGNVRSEMGDVDGALLDYDEAIRLEPREAFAFYNRGIAHSDKGDVDRALMDFTEAIRLKPDDADAFINRGVALAEKGDILGALIDHDRAVRLRPDDADGYYNRGVARRLKGDLAGALIDYNEAIRLKPDDADAFFNRALARRASGDAEGSMMDFAEASQLGSKPTSTAHAHWHPRRPA